MDTSSDAMSRSPEWTVPGPQEIARAWHWQRQFDVCLVTVSYQI